MSSTLTSSGTLMNAFIFRKEEILVNKIQPNEYCSDVPEGGINLDREIKIKLHYVPEGGI